jgi:hypothetical protein
VSPVNDAPEGTDKTITLAENTDYTLAEADFGFSDRFDNPPNSLLAVKITSLPTVGSLTTNGVAVGVDQFISVQDLNAGQLKFQPGSNENGIGYANFTFRVRDDGGFDGPGAADLDPTPKTITFDVGPKLTIQLLAAENPGGTNQVVLTWESFQPLTLQMATNLATNSTDVPSISWTYLTNGIAGANTFTYQIIGVEGYFRLAPTNSASAP